MNRLSTQEVLDAKLDDWRKLAQALHARYRIADFTAGAAFAAAVAQAAEAAGHHPDLKITSGVVDVSLCTHEDGLWVTQKDIDLARTISQIARQQGLTPEPAAVARFAEVRPTPAQAIRTRRNRDVTCYSARIVLATFWTIGIRGSVASPRTSTFLPWDLLPKKIAPRPRSSALAR